MIAADIPDGVRLVIDVGLRSLLTQDAVALLARESNRLTVEVEAARTDIAQRWVTALRGGRWLS